MSVIRISWSNKQTDKHADRQTDNERSLVSLWCRRCRASLIARRLSWSLTAYCRPLSRNVAAAMINLASSVKWKPRRISALLRHMQASNSPSFYVGIGAYTESCWKDSLYSTIVAVRRTLRTQRVRASSVMSSLLKHMDYKRRFQCVGSMRLRDDALYKSTFYLLSLLTSTMHCLQYPSCPVMHIQIQLFPLQYFIL